MRRDLFFRMRNRVYKGMTKVSTDRRGPVWPPAERGQPLAAAGRIAQRGKITGTAVGGYLPPGLLGGIVTGFSLSPLPPPAPCPLPTLFLPNPFFFPLLLFSPAGGALGECRGGAVRDKRRRGGGGGGGRKEDGLGPSSPRPGGYRVVG